MKSAFTLESVMSTAVEIENERAQREGRAHTEAQVLEYFTEWRAEIEKAEAALANQRREYAACMREYQACKKIIS